MVTISPEPSGSHDERIAQSHHARAIAESFGADPQRYDRARPRYPQALIDRLAATGPQILDVGCGTGIVARQLRDAGRRVLGVEPDVRMAEFARGTGIDVEVSTFEDWAPSGRRFDAVVAGMTWHWVNPEAGAAKAAEVLRPGGTFAAFWATAELPPELAAASARVYRRTAPQLPVPDPNRSLVDGYERFLDKTENGLETVGGFGAPQRLRLESQRDTTGAEWVDAALTGGGHNLLPKDTLELLADRLRGAADAIGDSFTVSCTTLATIAIHSG